MKVIIAAIGREKNSSPTTDLFHSYIKRIPWNVELKQLEEKKSLPPEQLMQKEAELLLGVANPKSIVIALDERGKNISSENFAEKIGHWQEQGSSEFIFMIGGAAGHGKAVRDRADLLLSFGAMTWPHMMIRPMLAEQLYRCHTILTGHPYHKA